MHGLQNIKFPFRPSLQYLTCELENIALAFKIIKIIAFKFLRPSLLQKKNKRKKTAQNVVLLTHDVNNIVLTYGKYVARVAQSV